MFGAIKMKVISLLLVFSILLVGCSYGALAGMASGPSYCGDPIYDYNDDGAIDSYELYFILDMAFKGAECPLNKDCDLKKDGKTNYWDISRVWIMMETCPVPNNPPELDEIGNQLVNAGDELSFEVTATDEDNDELTYSVEGLPEDATFEGQTFTWMPTTEQAGEYEITFIVSDGEDEDLEIIQINVLYDENTIWLKYFGMSDSGEWLGSFGDDIIESSDGYIILGRKTLVEGKSPEMWLFKINSVGEMVWDSLIVSDEENINYVGNEIKLTMDGGYIIAGKSIDCSSTCNDDGLIVKVDEIGNVIWKKNYGSVTIQESSNDVIETDNHFVFTGINNDDMWFVKISKDSGDIIIEKLLGSDNIEEGNGIINDGTGGYKITGKQKGNFGAGTKSKLTQWSLDNNGKQVSFYQLPGPYSNSYGSSIVTNPNTQYPGIFGRFCSSGGDDCKFLLTDIGSFDNTYKFDTGIVFPKAMGVTNSGYILIGDGVFNDIGGLKKPLVVKTGLGGQESWKKTFDENSLAWGTGNAGIQTSDGNYLLLGEYRKTINEPDQIRIIKYLIN
jgi:hypothetical protein